MSLAFDDQEKYKAIAKQATNDLIHNAFALQQQKMIARVQNQKTNRQAIIYSGHDTVDSSLPLLGSHTFLSASLEQIADFFILDSNAKCDGFHATLGNRVVARQELLSLVYRNSSIGGSAVASCSINWFAYESPIVMLARRDFCVLEVHNYIQVTDRMGVSRKGWVRCLHSVDLPWCPPVPDMVRTRLARSGLVVLETDTPGLLEVFYMFVPISAGFSWSLTMKPLVRRQVEKILRLEEYISYQQLDLGKISVTRPLLSRAHVTHCSHCPQKFRWFRSKRQCHRCFDAVCSACGTEWPIRGRKVFVCHDCFRPDGDELNINSTRPMTISIPKSKMDQFIKAVSTPDVLQDEELTADELDIDADDVMRLVCAENGLAQLCAQYSSRHTSNTHLRQ